MLNWTASGLLLLAFWFSPELSQVNHVPENHQVSNRAACEVIVDAGPDTNVCAPGGLIELMGSITGNAIFYQWTPYSGLSDPFILDPTATITGPITYTLSAYGVDPDNPNLVFNGDFSSGNVGFITDYNYVADIPGLQNEMVPEGTYTVLNNPNLVHTGFAACTDHTGGGGDMLIVNGAASFQDVWCQTVAIEANSFYNVSAWVASVNSSSPAELQFSINGTPIGAIINASSTPCVWTPFNATWNSGSNTTAEICILNLNTAAGGNDFAIDDIAIVGLCKVEDEVDITLYFEDAPEPVIDGPTFLCEGEIGTYTATFPPEPPIYSYQWTLPPGATIISGQGTPVITILWEDTQVSEICLEIETRCDMNDACFEVTVGTLPEFPLISGPTTLCPGETGTFYTPENDPDDIFVWTIASNLIVVSGQGTNEIEVEWALPGDTELCLEVTNVCGSVENCAFITLFPEYLTLFDTILCEGSTIIINGTTYGNGLFSGIEVFTSISGCDSIVEVDITEATSLEFMFTSNLCPGDSIFLEGAYQTQEGVYIDSFTTSSGCDSIVMTYLVITPFDTTWVFGLSCNSADTGITSITYSLGLCDSTVITNIGLALPDTTDILSFTCNPADTLSTSVVLTNQFGCDSLIRTQVLLSPSDSIFFYQTSCDPLQVGQTIDTFTNSSGCDSIIVTTVDFILSDTTLISQHSCFYTDTGTVSMLLMNQMGCDSLVIVNTLYGGSDTTFLNTTSCNPVDSGYSYIALSNQYACDSIISLYTLLLPSDTTFLSASSCLPGDTGIVMQVLTNGNGCDSTIITTTTLNPIDECAIETNISILQPLCFGDTSFVTVIAEVGLSPFTIEWKHAVQSLNGTVIINISPGVTILKLTQSGTYFIEVKSANGLSTYDTIAVDDTPPLTVTITTPVDAFGFGIPCYGDSSGMAISNLEEIGTPPQNYLWSDNSITPSIDELSAGIFSLTVTDANGCSTSASVEILQPAPMQYNFESTDITCFSFGDGSAILTDSTGGISPWITALDGGSFLSLLSYNNLHPGQHHLMIMDQNGCTSEERFLIEEPDDWSISLGGDTTIVIGQALELTVDVFGFPTGSLQTNWSDGNCDNCFTRVVVPANNTSYSVVAMDENGCTSEDQISIDVTLDRNLYVPNVFSPNGDQINDLFLITAGAGVEEIESLSIYDRWGNLIFQTAHFQPYDLSSSWDGTMNGELLNPGVYVYTLTVVFKDGVKEMRYGDVSLIR